MSHSYWLHLYLPFYKKIYLFFTCSTLHFFLSFLSVLSHLQLFFLNNFVDLVIQPAVPSIALKWIPVTRAVYSWTAGGAKGKLCRFAGCWKKNHSLEEVVGKRMSVYPFWFAVPQKNRKKKNSNKSHVPGNFLLSSRSLLETDAAEWDQTVSQSRTGVGGLVPGRSYLQRSSCVESRTFFLFLLLLWWCGLLLCRLLLPELCCPWWPLFWWGRDVLAWPEEKHR